MVAPAVLCVTVCVCILTSMLYVPVTAYLCMYSYHTTSSTTPYMGGGAYHPCTSIAGKPTEKGLYRLCSRATFSGYSLGTTNGRRYHVYAQWRSTPRRRYDLHSSGKGVRWSTTYGRRYYH